MSDADDPDESLESQAFRDALLNGDKVLNRLVKLIDVRFESQVRRTNKLRKETRDELQALRRDLAPVMALASRLGAVNWIALRGRAILAGTGSFIVALVSIIYALHRMGVFG